MTQSIIIENALKDEPPSYNSLNLSAKEIKKNKEKKISSDLSIQSPLPPPYLTSII